MNSQQVRYFLAVAKYKNFTDAAENSFVSQPAITRQIALMEQEIGLQLFKRDKRSVTVTPAGEIMKNAFIHMQAIYEDAVAYAHRATRGQNGTIRVGYINGLMLDMIPNVLKRFSQEYPNVEITFECLSFSALKKGLGDGTIDIGITLLLDVHNLPDLQWEKICSVPDGFVFSKNYPLARRENLTVADFKDAIFYIISPKEVEIVNELLINICKQSGFAPKRINYVSNPGSMLLMAESGQGVTLLDELTFNNIANKDALHFFKLEIVIDILATWKKENTNPLVPIFSSFLIQRHPPSA